MRPLTTKVTSAAAVLLGSLTVASPALADDASGSATPQLVLAQLVRHAAVVGALLAGIVLLSKGLGHYRRSVWRRRWIQRRNAPAAPAAQGWPTAGIGGRAVRPAPFSMHGTGLVSGSVARSATRL